MPKTDKEKKAEVFTILCNHKKVSVEGVKSITNFEDEFIKESLNSFIEEGLASKGKYAKYWKIKKMYKQIKFF
jgi:predicted transcriptional regulator